MKTLCILPNPLPNYKRSKFRFKRQICRALLYLVEVELLLSIGWGCRIREVGSLSRNRVVLVFDPKDGWLVVGTWLLNGWKMVVEHFAVVESWLEGGMNDGQDKDG